jgi:small subunit ribosomal protein S2
LEIERQQARGEFARLTKKEALMREREIARLNHRLGGLKEMRRLPNLLFVVDVRRDALAIKEANTLGIPIIAMVDTNCDPDPVDHVIPSNDDAIRAVKLMNSTMATAVLEGNAILSSIQAEEEETAGMEDDEALERYLGPSTLAFIQAEATETGTEEAKTATENVEEPVEEPAVETATNTTEPVKSAEEEQPVVAEESPAETKEQA